MRAAAFIFGLAVGTVAPIPQTNIADPIDQLRTAFRRGVRAYALGASITATFAGCFGSGCRQSDELSYEKSENGQWHGPMGYGPMRQYQERGFLTAFMRNLSATATGGAGPRVGSLYNRGMGGSQGYNEEV